MSVPVNLNKLCQRYVTNMFWYCLFACLVFCWGFFRKCGKFYSFCFNMITNLPRFCSIKKIQCFVSRIKLNNLQRFIRGAIVCWVFFFRALAFTSFYVYSNPKCICQNHPILMGW